MFTIVSIKVRECPYYNKNNNICTHKMAIITKLFRKKRRVCNYSNHLNCPMYKKWLDNKLKLLKLA